MKACFALYVAVNKYEQIEGILWTSGTHNLCSAALHHNFLVTTTTSNLNPSFQLSLAIGIVVDHGGLS